MNPYVLLGGVLAWIASLVATAWWGIGVGQDREIATQAREDHVAAVATQAAASAAAVAISKIEMKNVVIRQPLETIVRTEQVFHDCRSGPDAMRLLNATPGVAASAVALGASGVRASAEPTN